MDQELKRRLDAVGEQLSRLRGTSAKSGLIASWTLCFRSTANRNRDGSRFTKLETSTLEMWTAAQPFGTWPSGSRRPTQSFN